MELRKERGSKMRMQKEMERDKFQGTLLTVSYSKYYETHSW